MPERLFEPLQSWPFDRVAMPRDDFEQAVKLYSAMRGWDDRSCPQPSQLQFLNIGGAMDRGCRSPG